MAVTYKNYKKVNIISRIHKNTVPAEGLKFWRGAGNNISWVCNTDPRVTIPRGPHEIFISHSPKIKNMNSTKFLILIWCSLRSLRNTINLILHWKFVDTIYDLNVKSNNFDFYNWKLFQNPPPIPTHIKVSYNFKCLFGIFNSSKK